MVFFRKFEHLEINLGRSIRWNCRYYTVFCCWYSAAYFRIEIGLLCKVEWVLNQILMILSFFTQKSTRSAKLSSVFAKRFSGEGQADFAVNKAHKVSLKGRNNLYISCVFNGFKYSTILLWGLISRSDYRR